VRVALDQEDRSEQHDQDERNRDQEDPPPPEVGGDDSGKNESEHQTATGDRRPYAQGSRSTRAFREHQDDGSHGGRQRDGLTGALQQARDHQEAEGGGVDDGHVDRDEELQHAQRVQHQPCACGKRALPA
jgi:hypothetical protein